jgi:uncharacterized membrane protein
METRQWLRVERWLAVMLLMSAAAWMALHHGDLLTKITGMWLVLGVLGAVVCLRAQVKLQNGESRSSRRRRVRRS